MVEKDYITIGTVTAIDVFNKALAEKTQEYLRLGKPFDEPCARLEFRDKLEAAERESERTFGFIKDDIKIEVGDLDKYGDESLFELIEDQEDMADKVMEGMRTQVVMGHTLSYKCKKRGHGISVFIPLSKYEEMNAIKPVIKSEK